MYIYILLSSISICNVYIYYIIFESFGVITFGYIHNYHNSLNYCIHKKILKIYPTLPNFHRNDVKTSTDGRIWAHWRDPEVQPETALHK